MSDTPRARIARLLGEAARGIVVDALGPGQEPLADAFAAAITQSAAALMSPVYLASFANMTDAEVLADARRHMEPEVRRRLAEAGRMPS